MYTVRPSYRVYQLNTALFRSTRFAARCNRPAERLASGLGDVRIIQHPIQRGNVVSLPQHSFFDARPFSAITDTGKYLDVPL